MHRSDSCGSIIVLAVLLWVSGIESLTMTYRWVVDDLLQVTFFLSRRRRTEMESGHNGERRLSSLDCPYNTNIPTMSLSTGSKDTNTNSWKVGNRPVFPKQIVMVHASGVG